MSFPQRPAYLQAPNAALAERFAGGLTTPQPPNISIKNGRFTVRGASGETNRNIAPSLSLDCIIVDANPAISRMFFEGAYDPNNAAAPDCFSDNGEGPSAFAAKPQAPNCATCPQAVWGSAINQNGKAVPACSTKKKVAVMVPGSNELHLLAIPPNSLKGYRSYLDAISGNGALPYQLITRLSFADGEIGTLKFDFLDWIPQQLAAHVEGLIGSDEVAKVVGGKDKPRLAALPGQTQHLQIEASPIAHEQTFTAPAPSFQAPQQFAPPPPPAPSFQTFTAPNAQTMQAPVAEAPKRTRRSSAEVAAEKAAKEGQTFVAPGPIPAQTFGAPQQAPQQGGFIGGGQPATQAFGVASSAPPPSQAVEDMLAKAFSLPTS